MSPGVQIILSGALTFGVPLVIAARELVMLRRRGAGSWPPGEPPRGPAIPPPLSWRPSLPPWHPATFGGANDGTIWTKPGRAAPVRERELT